MCCGALALITAFTEYVLVVAIHVPVDIELTFLVR
jgi:hypothetical protein